MPACCHSAFTYQSRRKVVTDPTPFLVSLQSPKGPKSAFRSRRDRSFRISRALKKLRMMVIIFPPVCGRQYKHLRKHVRAANHNSLTE